MNIAILGFGTIGSGVYEIIEKQTALTSSIRVQAILIRKGKEKTLPIMVDDIEDIVNRTDIDTVVEVMGGIEPAHSYIRKCLEQHKHVVTANKAVVAKYLLEFEALAKQKHVKFLFEASTGGGIPWIHAIENVKRIDTVNEFHGIFNGTSNYILDHMYKDNAQFSNILKTAQKLGYAEADPSADIDGIDIRNKLQISASIAFNTYVPETFPVFGIRNLIKNDVEYFKEKKLVLKLMAKAYLTADGYHCYVEPCLYPITSMEANVPENFNLASIHGTTIGDLKFYGQGAGKLPTANAIIQDLLDILEHKTADLDLQQTLNYSSSPEKKCYILRTNAHEVLKDTSYPMENSTYHEETYYLIKQITTDDMHYLMEQILVHDNNAMMAAWEKYYD